MAECPHASEAYRGEIRDHLLELEADHPWTRHSVLSGYEELARLASEARRGGDRQTGACERCGASTRQTHCRKCQLVVAVHADESASYTADGRRSSHVCQTMPTRTNSSNHRTAPRK
jgi:uncharacterized protein (TIGR00269 family)